MVQYHDVRLKLKLRTLASVTNVKNGDTVPTVNVDDSFLLVNYVFLDAQERKKFAQATHEYLIEQLQFTGSESLKNVNESYRLNFNHPSKYLVWAPRLAKYNSGKIFVDWAWDGDWTAAKDRVAKRIWIHANSITSASVSGSEDEALMNHKSVDDADGNVLVDAQLVFHNTESSVDLLDNVVLLTNNLTSTHLSYTTTDWASASNALYDGSAMSAPAGYKVNDHMTYSTNADGTGNPVANGLLQLNGHDRFQQRDGAYFNYVQPNECWERTPADGINSFSFALNPMEHQPSGTCNFSRIDNTTLKLEMTSSQSDDSKINIYCMNYNVFRVMSGMGGLAYSN